ncbi:MAG: 50S ribosomal protein L19 [Patescibacteria group bacterium]
MEQSILDQIRPGVTIRVYEKTKEGGRKRASIFEGTVIGRKHGSEIGATFTVRRVSQGVGMEKIFPLHSPNIEKIEIARTPKVRRAKLYYLRGESVKESRKKLKKEIAKKEIADEIIETKIAGGEEVKENA